MGYELHITRKRSWSDSVGPEIGLDEWLAYIESDSTLAAPFADDPAFATWKGCTAYPETWFRWSEGGYIHTKNPDEATIDKMVEIARTLNAKVQGDDHEVYVSSKEILPEQG